jgi:hypothetical protein
MCSRRGKGCEEVWGEGGRGEPQPHVSWAPSTNYDSCHNSIFFMPTYLPTHAGKVLLPPNSPNQRYEHMVLQGCVTRLSLAKNELDIGTIMRTRGPITTGGLFRTCLFICCIIFVADARRKRAGASCATRTNLRHPAHLSKESLIWKVGGPRSNEAGCLWFVMQSRPCLTSRRVFPAARG